jgi:hypothetical protein
MDKVGVFYGKLEYFTAMWYILGTFGNLMKIWYIFTLFRCIVSRKNLATPHPNHYIAPVLEVGSCRFGQSRFKKSFL